MTDDKSAPTVPVVLANVPSCECNSCGETTFATCGHGWKIDPRRCRIGSFAIAARASSTVTSGAMLVVHERRQKDGPPPPRTRRPANRRNCIIRSELYFYRFLCVSGFHTATVPEVHYFGMPENRAWAASATSTSRSGRYSCTPTHASDDNEVTRSPHRFTTITIVSHDSTQCGVVKAMLARSVCSACVRS